MLRRVMPDRGEDKAAMALDEEIPGAVEVFRLELGDPITHASTPPGMARIYRRGLACQGKGRRRRDFRSTGRRTFGIANRPASAKNALGDGCPAVAPTAVDVQSLGGRATSHQGRPNLDPARLFEAIFERYPKASAIGFATIPRT